MIPGFLITLITFPGVIVHEFAHAIFCRLFGLPIYQVRYFQFTFGRGQAAGYVLHGRSHHAWQDVVVAIGPFFVNTIVGGLIAAPGVVTVLRFHGRDPVDLFLCWLGISIAMHSFPSTGDASSIWHTIKAPKVPLFTKIIGMPVIGLIYIGALGSFFWLDVLYGISVAGLLPDYLVQTFANRA